MAYLGLLAARVAVQPFGCLILLGKGPYRLEGGEAGRKFMFAAALETGRGGRKD